MDELYTFRARFCTFAEVTLLFSVFADTIRSFLRRPLPYLLVQWPLIVLLFTGERIAPEQINRMTDLILPFAVYLPAMVACLALATAGTWLVYHGRAPKDCLKEALLLLPRLYLPCLLSTIWILVGLPILLPAIYFSALFLFVPFLVLEEPGARAFSYLHRSRILARRRLGLSLTVATLVLLLDLAEMWLGESASVGVGALTGAPLVGAAAEAGIAAVLGANVNIGLVIYYLRLREAS